jgi:hypothetical protein
MASVTTQLDVAPIDTGTTDVAHIERESTEGIALCGKRIAGVPAPPSSPRCEVCRVLYDRPAGNPALN